MRSTLLTRIGPVVIFVGALAASSAGAIAPEQPRNGLIAFVDDRAPDDGGEIYAVGIRGGQARDVGLRRVPDSNPVVSPDGRRFAFFSARGGFTALYVARSGGGGVRRVTGRLRRGQDEGLLYGLAGLEWSPDGRSLAFDGLSEISVVSAAGGKRREIGKGVGPSWSSDGTRLAYSAVGARRSRIVVVTRAGKRLWSRSGNGARFAPRGERLAFSSIPGRTTVVDAGGGTLASIRGTFVSWSPDGRRVTVSRGRASTLYVIAWNGRGAHRLADGALPVWSPDSRQVAFGGSVGGSRGIWVAGVSSGRPRLVAFRGRFGSVSGWSARGGIIFMGDFPANDGPRSLYSVRPSGSGLHRVARARAGSALSSAAFAGRGATVVYRSENTAGSDVYSVRPDGTAVRALIPDGRQKATPAWSPDGTAIAYARADDVGRCHGCRFQIYVRRLSGGRTTLIGGRNLALGPVWSPDGARIAFLDDTDEGQTVVIADLAGSEPRDLATGYGPSWSPDGTRIAFTHVTDGQSTVAVARGDGSDLHDLVRGVAPSWSPDGARIAFAMRGLQVMNADGSDVRTAVGGPAAAPAWSPDGRWIAYSTVDAIRAVHPDGSEDHLVVQGTDAPPAWSPDGEWILYSGVNVVRVDGSGKRRVTAGSAPNWQPLPE